MQIGNRFAVKLSEKNEKDRKYCGWRRENNAKRTIEKNWDSQICKEFTFWEFLSCFGNFWVCLRMIETFWNFLRKNKKNKEKQRAPIITFFKKIIAKLLNWEILRKQLKSCCLPRALGNQFRVFGSLVDPRPLQELRSRRSRSQRNSHFPKDLKPTRLQRLQRLADDACQCEEIKCRLRIASSGPAAIVAHDRRPKTKTVAICIRRKQHLPPH